MIRYNHLMNTARGILQAMLAIAVIYGSERPTSYQVRIVYVVLWDLSSNEVSSSLNLVLFIVLGSC